METRAISFYNEFNCLAGQCPACCCLGWRIPIDDDTLRRYKDLTGIYGRHIRFFTNKRSDPPTIRRIFGKCPFLDSDGLCMFQRIGRIEDMPLVCRIYPRDTVQCADTREITFELSCPVAARLLLTHHERLTFETIEHDVDPLVIIDNEDPDFLDYLIRDRERLLDFLWDGSDELPVKWQAMYAYSRNCNDRIVGGRMGELSEVKLSTSAGDQGDYYIDRKPTYAFFSVKTLDRMIIDHLDYGAMPIRNPKFYKLIKQYLKIFSDETEVGANELFDKTVRKMTSEDPDLYPMYRSYFSYCIQELYILAYENYFVLKQIIFAILYVEFFMIFDVAEYLSTGHSISLDRQVEILTLCEHCIRHNPALTENLLAVMREEFL